MLTYIHSHSYSPGMKSRTWNQDAGTSTACVCRTDSRRSGCSLKPERLRGGDAFTCGVQKHHMTEPFSKHV